jgi:hypothetical protein
VAGLRQESRQLTFVCNAIARRGKFGKGERSSYKRFICEEILSFARRIINVWEEIRKVLCCKPRADW